MVKISASLLSARNNLKETLEEFNNLNIDYIHLDIMDGIFVSNNSFSEEEINLIVSNSNKKLDVHLMVEKPEDYVNKYDLEKVEFITIHYESSNVLNAINKIKSINKKVGISIKPNTNLEVLYPILDKVDLVLLMSVEPGKGGQAFMTSTLFKIEKLKSQIQERNLNTLISVDGGINEKNYKDCKKNGANILVIGSSLVYTSYKKNYINIIKGIDL